jgi:GDP-L-fucose synthase
MDKNKSSIYVAGATGLVGSSIVRLLKSEGYVSVFTNRVELKDWWHVKDFFFAYKPTHVFMCAAKVGGILANRDFPATFITDNLLIQSNLIQACREYSVEKYIFLGSSCNYPKLCPQPIKEEYLMTGPLEPTNSPYAMAKLAGVEMVKAYRRQYGLHGVSLMPTNLYGPNDNFSLNSSHVLPAMIRKFHEAKLAGTDVTLWGSGCPRREFLHVDDLATACLHIMQNYDGDDLINIGWGEDVRIKELAELVAKTVGFQGEIIWDLEKPDGTARKLLDIERARSLGWEPTIRLEDGLQTTYKWFLENVFNKATV